MIMNIQKTIREPFASNQKGAIPLAGLKSGSYLALPFVCGHLHLQLLQDPHQSHGSLPPGSLRTPARPLCAGEEPFDLTCLATTALITFAGLGHVKGLGIGTVIAALTVGRGVGFGTSLLRQHVDFVSVFEPDNRSSRPPRQASAAV